MKKPSTPVSTFELPEWQSRLLEGESLTPTDQRLKQELETGKQGRLIVDELRTGLRVAATSWVGVVRFEQFEIRIIPKLAGDNLGLVEMIEFATGLDALRRNSSSRTLQAEETSLFDLFALLLAEASENILRGGLLSDYVEYEGELSVLRGRLLADQQILRRFGQVDRLVCRFDELEQNIVENQILAAALNQCAVRVTHESVRQRCRRLLSIFKEICRIDELNLQAARNRITYNRLNEHYRDAHALAWLLLDGLGIKDLLAVGDPRCFAFLIDMNRLFEMFIYRLIDKLFAGNEYRIHYQCRDRFIILNAWTNQPYAHVVPDILVDKLGTKPLARVAVDAKYKLYSERKISSEDVYQGFLYAYAYGASAMAPSALLVFPSSTKTCEAVRLRICGKQAQAGAEISAVGLSIPVILAELKQKVQGHATLTFIKAIKRGFDCGVTS